MYNSIQLPTKIRVMSQSEYSIVSRVFDNTLPYKFRIWITNGAGQDGRAFVIPTSLVSTILNIPIQGFFALSSGYLASAVNFAYLVNVGDAYGNLTTTRRELLVHEMTHVWQGKNSTFAHSYVYNSIINQCLKGQSAYDYVSGNSWSSYNAEQQAKIVQNWFENGEQESDSLFPYIRDHIRKGDA